MNIDEERWLLCVDPDSRHIYTMNTNSQEVRIELDVPNEYRQLAFQAIDDIEKLIKLRNGNWLCVSKEVDQYRRRTIPSYLLQKQSSSIPIYLAQSTLSLAFAEVKSIQLFVYLQSYVEQFPEGSDYKIELEAALVTSADEIIKIILRVIYEKTSIKLKTINKNSQFVLQVHGIREYITGSYPLLQFDRIRQCLRGLKRLDVQLSEVPMHQQSAENFPPLVIRGRGASEQIDWRLYQNVPILLWYPPFQLPKYNEIEYDGIKLSQINQSFIIQSGINQRVQSEGKQMAQELKKQTTINYDKKLNNISDQLKQQVKVLYNQHMRQQRRERQTDYLYSGQCDAQFKIQLIGINQLLQIFEHDVSTLKTLRATYNGIMPLQFITKSDAKPHQQHNVSKKKERSSSLGDAPKNTKPIPLKLTNKRVDLESHENLSHPSQLKNIAFGGVEYQQYIKILQDRYGIDFTPYYLSVRVALYHGTRLLTNWCTLESRQIPFNLQPQFDQVIKFNSIKISQLPLESRLCFNILIYSSNGHSQIIGSAQMYIFNQNMIFRQGVQQLNIWPFCKVDPRLQCMGQYWGITDKQLQQQLSQEEFIKKHYGRLIIQLDEFCQDMKFSLRNEKNMIDIGLCKEIKSLSYYVMTLKNDKILLKQIKENSKKESQSIEMASKNKQRQRRQNIGSEQRSSSVVEFVKSNYNQPDMKNPMTSSIIQYNSFFQSRKLEEERYAKKYPYKNWYDTPTTQQLAYTQILLNVTPIQRTQFSKYDKYTLMKCRNHLKTLPQALQVFLLAVDWSDPEQVGEAHRMLQEWIPVNHENALPLLDALYADSYARMIAVQRLSELDDDELALYMLELTQALMFEKNLLNPLTELLLERSLANPWVVGHELFWLLRSQLHVKPSYERFAIIIEQLLMLSGSFRQELLNEIIVNDEINQICEAFYIKSNEKILPEILRKGLIDIRKKIPQNFSFALDSRLEVQGFNVNKCKILDSKKKPLWLVAESSSAINLNQSNKDQTSYFKQAIPPIMIIFKNGDDMRQDLLTLQLIRIMDKIWLDSGIDFRMKPYRVIATADQVGMIEIVLNSETISKIHHNAGTLGAFDHSSIQNFLKLKNPTIEGYEIATQNFLRSCAGYCVATYILGIGDRHSGNIMLCESGHLFHIDFGHFLGNFKSKLGFKRERSPFVLTMEMAQVMGGQNSEIFKKFEDFCTEAYNLVRKHGAFLINIFLMNLSAGMPELENANDVKYLQDQLALNISDQEATALFRSSIKNSLNDQWRNIDNFIHNLKRKG